MDVVWGEGSTKAAGSFEAKVGGAGVRDGEDAAGLLEGRGSGNAGGFHCDLPRLFKPPGEEVPDLTRDVDEVEEGAFHFIFVRLDVGAEDDAFAATFEPEDGALHKAEKDAPISLLESGVTFGDVKAVRWWALLVDEGLDEYELDKGGEGIDNDRFYSRVVRSFKEEFGTAFEEFGARGGLSSLVGERGVVEPLGAEAFVLGEELHRATKIAVTVKDKGLGKLERHGGFACAGGADEEEGLREGGEEVGGGFHVFVD